MLPASACNGAKSAYWQVTDSLIRTHYGHKKRAGKLLKKKSGGGRGIRTPVHLSTQTVFKTAGFNHSPIPPLTKLAWTDPLEALPGSCKILQAERHPLRG